MKKQKSVNITRNFFLILLIFMIFSAINNTTLISNDSNSESDSSLIIDAKSPKLAASYSENWVHINNNWSLTDTQHGWCEKRGNTYYIENLTVDNNNAGHGILIENSIEPFVIQNVKVNESQSNCGSIRLNTVKNGTIKNSYLRDNYGYGIMMVYCNNITINNNLIKDNDERGIRITASNNTVIKENVIEGSIYGIYVADSLNFTVIDNTIRSNMYAIYISKLNNTLVSGNMFQSNTNNINQINCKNNIIEVNSFEGIWTPIAIDDSGAGNLTWSKASEMNWCNGSGTYGDPYIIKNMVINSNSLKGIFVNNSNVYFEITGCKIYNGGSGINGAILLFNTNNSRIEYNNCSQNAGPAIYLRKNCFNNTLEHNNASYSVAGFYILDSNNNNVSNCRAFKNSVSGIYINRGHYNIVKENEVFNNTFYGIELSTSNNSIVKSNIVRNNVLKGIYVYWYSNNSLIENNIVYKNDNDGISISGALSAANIKNEIIFNNISENYNGIIININSDDSIVKDNLIKSNVNYGVQIKDAACTNNFVYNNTFNANGINANDVGANNYWNLTDLGNYWSNYSQVSGGVDLNDDGIGDVTYPISGTSNAKDFNPIWDDGHNGTTIHIDNLGINAWSWSQMQKKLWTWVLGSGTQTDPYRLSNLIINAQNSSSGILIENSNEYFTLENCVIKNSSAGINAGILLNNVSIGRLYEVNCSYNQGHGIILYNSTSIAISNSFIVSNGQAGVLLNNSNYINISMSNEISHNSQGGIKVYNSQNNTISNNVGSINDNGNYGIYFYNSHKNKIFSNSISNSHYGIYLENSNYNEISGNTLTSNEVGIKEINCVGNVFSNNFDDSLPTGDDDDASKNPKSTIDLLPIVIIGVIVVLSLLTLIIISKKKKKPANVKEDKLLKAKKTVKDDPFNEFVEKINKLSEEGLHYFNQGDFLKSISLWEKSIDATKEAIIEAEKLFREDYISECEKQSEELNKKILDAKERQKKVEAMYFQDISNVHLVIVIHKGMGASLGDIELHRGEAFDKDLVSGFISAIHSFTAEMKQKAGFYEKSQKYEILSKGFNITLYISELLILAIVSENKLNIFMDNKCYDLLFKYENLHQKELKIFRGALNPFSDIPEFLVDELDLKVNNKSAINTINFEKFECPESIKNVLEDLFEKDEKFYPALLPKLISNKTKMDVFETTYWVYIAFKTNVFTPIQEKVPSHPTEQTVEINLKDRDDQVQKLEQHLTRLNGLYQQNESTYLSGALTLEKYTSNKEKLQQDINKTKEVLKKYK